MNKDEVLAQIVDQLATTSVLVIATDGHIVARAGSFSKNEDEKLAALSSGILSASNSLINLINTNQDQYKVVCSQSDRGVVLEQISKKEWLVALYNGVENPGELRMQLGKYLRILRSDSSDKSLSFSEPINSRTNEGQTFFENISDEEIDELFNI